MTNVSEHYNLPGALRFGKDVTGALVRLPRIPDGLITRLRQIVSEQDKFTLQNEFRDFAESHPAMPVIKEIVFSYRDRIPDLIRIFERADCIVGFDRFNQKLTVGLNLAKLNRHFNEHVPVQDPINKRTLDLLNGINPILDRKPIHHVPQLESKTYYLVFDFNKD